MHVQVFDMLESDSSFVKNIKQNTTKFRTEMTKAGFTIAGEDHPISPGNKYTFFMCRY